MVLIFFGTDFARAALADRQLLPGHVPEVISQLTPLGRVPAADRLNLAIGLPLRNEAELDELLRQIYDPQSTNYHKYLQPPEFTARFGPTEQDYQAVIQFAEANGLTVTARHSNRVVLDVSGSVSNLEQAFQVRLHRYRHPTEDRNFFTPDTEPSVPVNVPVKDIWGLSDFALPKPMLRKVDPAKARPLSNNGTAQFGYYQGSDFRKAYVPGSNLAGSGQTVAVVELEGYYVSDITNYEAQIGYTNVPLQNVYVDNVSGIPGYSGDTNVVKNAVIEVSLDIEMIIAMAPALSKVMVYEGSSLYDVFNKIATDDQARQVACSWYYSAGPNTRFGISRGTTLDSQLKQMGVQGQAFFEASGDSDAYTAGQSLKSSSGPIPMDSIYVTSVGGTSLSMNGAGASWSSESVWNWGGNVGSGGGISTNYSIPSWQTAVNVTASGGSAIHRNIPDVALTADSIYVLDNNGHVDFVGGTSCAAPLWAAFCALVNQQAAAVGGPTNAVGFLNPALYAIGASPIYPACFHDITTGNNVGNYTPGLFYATNGYDLCTGLGTPNGTNLINALAPPAMPYFIIQPVSRTVTNGNSFTLSANALGQASLVYTWLLNGTNLPVGGNVSGLSSNVLSFTSATVNNAGNYSLIVSNSNGSVTSSVVALTVVVPPAISAQPTNLTVLTGGNAVFTASLSGTTPLAYQWFKNGVSLANGGGIAGSTTNQLTLTSVDTNSAGNFKVVVTNLYGSVTSSVAVLTIVQPPVITTPLAGQAIQCSSNIMFAITAAGSPPPAYQWSVDGVVIAGATTASLTLTNVHLPSHLVSVLVTNLYGSATNTVTLTVQDTQAPVITLLGGNPMYIELGSPFNDPGATATDACAGVVSVQVTGTVNTSALGTNQLAYSAQDGSGNSNSLSRFVIVRDTTPPVIQWSFTNLMLAAGSNCAAPMPDVTGTNYILATDLSGPPVFTQSLVTNTLLAVGTNIVVLTATDISGNAAFSTNTIVVLDQTPPVILSQPQSETNLAGSTASFTVTATACTPLTYAWFFNSTNFTGQTNAILLLPNLGPANAGNYSVVATANGGSATSSVATLTVTIPLILAVSDNPGGGMLLNLTGPVGASFTLEMTTNLLFPDGWLPVDTNLFDANGAAQFIDSSATNDSQRFYRALLAP